jgi:hypothetical protein
MTPWISKAGHLSRPPQAVGEQPTSSWVGTNGCHSNLIQIVCKLVHMCFVIIQSSINLLLLSRVKLIVMDYSCKANLLGYYCLWLICGLLRFEQPNWVDVHFLRKEAVVLISSQFFMLKLQNPCYSTWCWFIKFAAFGVCRHWAVGAVCILCNFTEFGHIPYKSTPSRHWTVSQKYFQLGRYVTSTLQMEELCESFPTPPTKKKKKQQQQTNKPEECFIM